MAFTFMVRLNFINTGKVFKQIIRKKYAATFELL